MKIVTTTEELARVCAEIARHPFVTVDTEFLRETTFWPELCLLQMACPGDAFIVDVACRRAEARPVFRR